MFPPYVADVRMIQASANMEESRLYSTECRVLVKRFLYPYEDKKKEGQDGTIRKEVQYEEERMTLMTIQEEIEIRNLPNPEGYWRTEGGIEVELISDEGLRLFPPGTQFTRNERGKCLVTLQGEARAVPGGVDIHVYGLVFHASRPHLRTLRSNGELRWANAACMLVL